MNEPWENFSPYWLETTAPSGANGGLLDSLMRPAEPWNDPQPTMFAQTPWGSMTPPPSLFGLSPTFPPAPPPSSWDSSSASLWQKPSGTSGGLLDSLMRPADEPWNDPRPTIFAQTPWGSMTPPPNPFGLSPIVPPAPLSSSWGSLSASLWHTPFSAYAAFPAPPTQQVLEPWNDPRSAIFAQTPWMPMTPPPPFVAPSTFPPALPLQLQHLDSGKYWPTAPAPSGANEQSPAHGFYFRPMPQAPSWDSVPTYPTDGVAPSFSQPPSPKSWVTPAPPLEHLDSGKYWPVAPSVANDQPPAHGFYFPPMPQAPSWDSVPTYPADGTAQSNSHQPSPASWATAAPPLEHLDSGKYWPVAPSVANDQRPAHGFYFSPVPQAPSWDSVTVYPADNAAPSLSQPPSPASWATPTPGVNAAGYLPADEPAIAQQAFDASAKRIVRGVRGRATAPYEPPARNPEADEGEPGLIERVRLNGMDSFYRGTLMGAGRLALMQHYASTPDEAGIDPQTKRWRDQLRKEYPGVVADLARYDRMRRFENPAEFGAAALGQLGGGLPTPESLVGVGAKGVTWLGRAIRAGLQQGAVNAATDPAVQGLNMRAGVQDEYDPWRTAMAPVLGFATGVGTKSAADVLGGAGARALDVSPTPPRVGRGEARYVERDGLRYVARADGSDILGEITPEIGNAIGREAAPIRLPQGGHDFHTGKGFGELHIAARHGDEIKAIGYEDVGDFVSDIVSGFNEIYRAQKGGLYVVKRNGHSLTAVIELSPVGRGPDGHWLVETAALYRSKFFKKKDLLWSRPGQGGSPPEGGSSLSP